MEVDSNIAIQKSNNFFSPLRYPGGKSSLSSYFTTILSKNQLNSIYAEPYAGGAGAALELLFKEKVEKIIINDFDKSIFAIWYSILNNPKDFISRLNKAKLCISEWQKVKANYRNLDKCISELGFSAFYLNRTNRSGILTGGPIGGIGQQGKWKLDARFNKEKLVERIERIVAYKNRIIVTNMDGISFISKYKRRKDIFFYIDPPYYLKGRSLYYNHYVNEDHERLASFLVRNNQLNWILTYDNVPQIKKLYWDFRTSSFDLNYHASRPKIGNEIMIYSDSIKL